VPSLRRRKTLASDGRAGERAASLVERIVDRLPASLIAT